MIRNVLHRIVANPRVYDLVQWAVGGKIVDEHIRRVMQTIASPHAVIDIGGGTGTMRELLPADCLYICLDIDPQKLSGIRTSTEGRSAILGDATRAPFRTNSIDMVVCKFLYHHITNELAGNLLDECYRTLKPEGLLLFVEPLRNDRRFRSRFLWKYDRGSFPRSVQEIKDALSVDGNIIHCTEFSCIHQYIVCVVRPNK